MVLKRIGTCECGLGACCRGFRFTLERIMDRDEIRYYKLHRVEVSTSNGKTVLRFNLPCSQLDPKTGLCRIYGKGRPIVCVQYPREEDIKFLPKECTFKFIEE